MSNTDKSVNSAGQGTTEAQVLDQILSLSQEINSIRKKTVWVSVCGVLVILAVLIIFLVSLVNAGLQFDQTQLANETINRASELARNPEILAFQDDFQDLFIPELKTQFANQVQQRLPEFQGVLQQEASGFVDYVQNDVRNSVLRRLSASFQKMEQDLVAKHAKDGADTKELEAAFKDFELKLAEKLSASLDRNLFRANQSLTSLNDSINQFKNTAEYKKVAAMDNADVEKLLLESFLELWIYNINPARGAVSVSQSNGGI